MARFAIGTPRGIGLVLAIGSTISIGLMLSSVWLSKHQQGYSEAINNAGRLRYLSQRYGLLVSTEILCRPCAPSVASELPSANSVFQNAISIILQLLGDEVDVSTQFKAPELVDADAKNELRSWQIELQKIKDTQPGKSASTLQLREFNLKIIQLVSAMDSIVDLISERAEGWIRLQLALHVIRVVWQVCFYAALVKVFRVVWAPFVATFNKLQSVQQQQQALLQADFDAVVEINAYHPFEVCTSCAAFDHIVGKQMAGTSILDAATNQRAKANLSTFLSSNTWSPPKPSPTVRKSHWLKERLHIVWRRAQLCAWPNMDAACNMSDCRVAPKINSEWTCDVELFVVRKSSAAQDHNGALIAVRQLGHAIRESMKEEESPTRIGSQSVVIEQNIQSDVDAVGDPRGENVAPSSSSGNDSISRSSERLFEKYTRRKLPCLDNLRVTFDIEDEDLAMQTYTLSFANPSPGMGRGQGHRNSQLDFGNSVLGRNARTMFRAWLQSSINVMLHEDLAYIKYDGDASYVQYDREVLFRPPNVTTASPTVVLSADTVRLTWASIDEQSSVAGSTFSLLLSGISQASSNKPTRRHSVRTQSSFARLPVISEPLGLARL